MTIDLGWGFALEGEFTPREKQALESAVFAAEQEAHADVMFGTVGDTCRDQKSRLVAEAVSGGAREVFPSWYRGGGRR